MVFFMMLLKVSSESQGDPDVPGLAPLIAASQEDDHCSPALLVIHPVTRAVIDSEFRNSVANRLHISGVPCSESLNPCLYARPALEIP
jgi:hypothetical protein